MSACLRWLLLWLVCANAAFAQPSASAAPAVEVWLATIEPGEVYWQRFGHNAIILRDASSGRGVSYNFGYFDFAQQDFLLRFVRGRMLYQAVALDADADLAGYADDGRRVWLQRLRLGAEATETLAAYLHREVQPDRRDYRYDYYAVNCSTRVRDALDLALGGALKASTEHRSHGWSYRRYTRAYAQEVPWLYLGTDLALGQPVDRTLSLWEEMFIPGELKRRLRETEVDGLPVVVEERLLPVAADPAEIWPVAPDWRAQFAASGLLLAGLLVALKRLAERGGWARWPMALSGAGISTLLGVGGLLLAGLWLGTDHNSAWRNQNLLLLSPLWLLSLPAWWQLGRHGVASGLPARCARIAGWVALGGVVCAALLKVFRSLDQGNIEWLLLIWPLVLALRYALRETREAA